MKHSVSSSIKSTNWIAIALAVGMLLAWSSTSVTAAGANRVRDAIWANGQLYGTVATPAFFKNAPEGSTDIIYSFDGSGLMGHRSVAEAAPGDPDYNGGRWHVKAVTFTEMGLMFFDSDGSGTVDFELTTAEDVIAAASAGYLVISDTEIRFECPLLPQAGG